MKKAYLINYLVNKYITLNITYKAITLARLRDRVEVKENILQQIMTKYNQA